jgi:hypothetical protein
VYTLLGCPIGTSETCSGRVQKQKKQRQKEARIRNRIEGAFGDGKRRFGLGMVMAKLRETSESWIAMVIFVMNIAHWLRDIILSVFKMLQNWYWRVLFTSYSPYLQIINNEILSFDVG